jgi:hypothetical protein
MIITDYLPPRETILTINATAIAGSIIFLSFSQVGVAFPAFVTTKDQILIAQIYKGIGALFALGFLGPFSISTVCCLMKASHWHDAARKWTIGGFILVPVLALILVIQYFLTGYNVIGYIPAPSPK